MTSLFDLGQTITPQVEYPGDNCCYLYELASFKGLRERVCHENSKKSFWITTETGESSWDNKLSSYYCGKNVWFNMCRHGPHNSGMCTGYDSNSGAGHHMNFDLKDPHGNYEGFDNDATYMNMGPYNPSEVGAINLF